MYFGLTPGATGIAEGGFALLFSSHVAKADIVSLTVLWRFFTVYAGTLAGLVLFYTELFRTSLARKTARRKTFAPEGRPLRIAMFTNNYYPFIGGVPISIERLSSALRNLGHHAVIFAPEYKAQNDSAQDNVIRCKLLVCLKTKLFDFHIANIFSRTIEREFVRQNFDIVHVHHPFWMGTKGLSLARKYGIPAVITYHTRFDMYHHYMPVFKRYFKKYLSHRIVLHFAQNCDMVFAPAESSAEYLKELGVTKPIEIMPTGAELMLGGNAPNLRQAYTPRGELLLCSVSRLAREKNIFFLLEGIKYIKSYGKTPFKCVIIGDGPERDEIEKFIKDENLSDTVILTGTVEPGGVGKFYFASDIFVYASKSETQGMVLIEAMAGRCPVVAVTSGGVDDVVTNGFNGYKTAESTQEWAQKVMLLMDNEDLRAEMSANAQCYAGKFSTENVALQAVKAYNNVITNI
jgi:glycosyltransferase involved in cell wall biosynthesis